MSIKYIPLGGAGKVTQNMHVFESEKDIIIIDAGIGFPDVEQFGVDVLIPDVTYLRNKLHKVRGIIITHAHEDHIGGLPYILKDLGPIPIYATKLPRGFIQSKLDEFGLLPNQTLHLIEPDQGSFNLGEFTIHPYYVNHSVPDALGLFIRTSVGNLVYSPDFKFDWTPVDGRQFEISKLAQLSSQGVLCLFSDCLGSIRPGYTESEMKIQTTFEHAMESAPKQVFITTMSSNISRIQQAINASVKYGRRVVALGRSIEQNLEIAMNLGYLNLPPGTIMTLEKTRRIPSHKLTYIIAGSYGQKGSALDRLARNELRNLQLKGDAVVIFSADPIPGIYDQVHAVIDALTEKGARVMYSEIQDDLHVSGHGSQGDLAMMIGLCRPQYFVPIGGTPRHQRGYSDLVEQMRFDRHRVFELRQDQTVEIQPGEVKLGAPVATKDVFVDGSLVGDVGRVILEDRIRLAEEGVVVLIVKKLKDGRLDTQVDMVSRGFVYKAESAQLMKKAYQIASQEIKKSSVQDWANLKNRLEQTLNQYFYQQTKRKPMVLSVLVNV